MHYRSFLRQFEPHVLKLDWKHQLTESSCQSQARQVYWPWQRRLSAALCCTRRWAAGCMLMLAQHGWLGLPLPVVDLPAAQLCPLRAQRLGTRPAAEPAAPTTALRHLERLPLQPQQRARSFLSYSRTNAWSCLTRLWQGFLTKLGARISNWKVRFFVLEDDRLKYYKTPVRGAAHLSSSACAEPPPLLLGRQTDRFTARRYQHARRAGAHAGCGRLRQGERLRCHPSAIAAHLRAGGHHRGR